MHVGYPYNDLLPLLFSPPYPILLFKEEETVSPEVRKRYFSIPLKPTDRFCQRFLQQCLSLLTDTHPHVRKHRGNFLTQNFPPITIKFATVTKEVLKITVALLANVWPSFREGRSAVLTD